LKIGVYVAITSSLTSIYNLGSNLLNQKGAVLTKVSNLYTGEESVAHAWNTTVSTGSQVFLNVTSATLDTLKSYKSTWEERGTTMLKTGLSLGTNVLHSLSENSQLGYELTAGVLTGLFALWSFKNTVQNACAGNFTKTFIWGTVSVGLGLAAFESAVSVAPYVGCAKDGLYYSPNSKTCNSSQFRANLPQA
jgi:hypothetical protein